MCGKVRLANALSALVKPEHAAERFRQAVESDPSFAEAWNTLGNDLFQLGERETDMRALRRALDLALDYADAHLNLAESLAGTGQLEEARRYWRSYLKLDQRSQWADRARQRLLASSKSPQQVYAFTGWIRCFSREKRRFCAQKLQFFSDYFGFGA